MMKQVHFIAATVATLTLAACFVSTLLVEFLGSSDAVAHVKRLIVLPGLLILVPAIAATGGTGFALSKSRQGRLVDAKKKRMPFIAVNGLMILIPCAILLDSWASQSAFDARVLSRSRSRTRCRWNESGSHGSEHARRIDAQWTAAS